MQEKESPPILEAKGLFKSFGKRTVVNNVSLKVQAGEIVGLLGPNGAGKTSTFSCIAGLLKPDRGNVFIHDHDVTQMPIHKRAAFGMNLLPQESSVFRKLTSFENIKVAVKATAIRTGNTKDLDNKVKQALEVQELWSHRHTPAQLLSGGQKRRLEIARALATEPRVLLFDEPFAGVDPVSVDSLHRQLDLIAQTGIGILITDHNVRETLSICSRSYVMTDGEIWFSGKKEEILQHPQIRKNYLGNSFS